MPPKNPVDWPTYSHDESAVCDTCAGNGFIPTKNQLHPHRTCSDCAGSGCVTLFHERKAT